MKWRSSSSRHVGRTRFVIGRAPTRKPGRRLNDIERREIETRLRAEGRLQQEKGSNNAMGTRT
jgi:hypothetical protein